MNNRRDFFKHVFALGALQGLAAWPGAGAPLSSFLDQNTAQQMNPDFDRESYDFWSGFLDPRKIADPVITAAAQSRGLEDNELQPVFLHYSSNGFKNAAEIDAGELISEGDVSVSLNTSTLRIAPEDQETFEHLQNAQIRVDVAQKSPILPVLEAMSYTVVSGMLPGPKKGVKSSPAKPMGGKGDSGSIQSISIGSDATWQKMQNILLPQGEGRWALNLEAQKKDSLFFRLLQNVIKDAGRFAPMIGLTGIFMSGLQSFNILYGAIHAQPVAIIKSNPLRVFATQEAVRKTGAPGAVSGIMLKNGTYVLIPAAKAPSLDTLKDLAVVQGRVVPPNTKTEGLDAAAAETLKDVTYATFDVEVRPTRLFVPQKAS
jgi:hypothetical protein